MPNKFHALAPKGNNAAPKAKSTENSKTKASKKKPHKKKKEVLHWMFSSSTHYKPDAAKAIIDASGYHKSTRKQLWWLFKRMRYSFSQGQLEKGMEAQFGLKPRTVGKRLEQLQELGINPIPLRKDFYLEQLPSLPLILELLEDDSTSVILSSNGEIAY